jgi:hypothetical protein
MKKRNRKKDQTNLESPLGLADEPITTTSSDHIEDTGDPSSRRKRARALGEDGIDHQTSGLGDLLGDEHDGSAGTDMGYGGDGTTIKPTR